jgi:hypothetical protein
MHPIKKWHELIETGNKEIYDEILADNVVFYFFVVHTPQKGKEITKIYLSAAGNVFGDSKYAQRFFLKLSIYKRNNWRKQRLFRI